MNPLNEYIAIAVYNRDAAKSAQAGVLMATVVKAESPEGAWKKAEYFDFVDEVLAVSDAFAFGYSFLHLKPEPRPHRGPFARNLSA